MSSSKPVKIMVMGQGGVGKTALVSKYITGTFPDQYSPTIDDMHTKDIERGGRAASLEIYDTAGQEAYSDLRNSLFGKGHGYVLVYAVNDDSTFRYLVDRGGLWDQILDVHPNKRVPFLLVGSKSDLESTRAVLPVEREKVARDRQTQSMECSAKANENVSAVFERIVDMIFTTNTDPTLGSGGGSVLGAGATPAQNTSTQSQPKPKKGKKCVML